MPTTHTVVQGETLSRIAKKYKFSSWKTIYNHPENAEFKALRSNPNIIFAGDKIVIPDKEPSYTNVSAGQKHVFKLKREQEKFLVRMLDEDGDPLDGAKVVIEMGQENLELLLNGDGLIEVPLKGTETSGTIKVFATPDSTEPSAEYEVQLGYLDPVEELSGVQARCNLLGFDCGVADGIMGAKTRAGVQAFQEKHGLDVDGVPGPMTQKKLLEVYGC